MSSYRNIVQSPDSDLRPLLGQSSGRSRKFLTYGTDDAILGPDDAELARGKFEVPTSDQLTRTQIAISFGYIAGLMTSWVDTSLRHKILFPRCTQYWAGSGSLGPWMSCGCVSSILLYWTLPLFCCQVLLVYFYRDLLQSRMYYEFFSHRVFLDFTNVPFLDAISVRMMLGWCALCFAMYPLTGTTGLFGILQTLPFWFPVLSRFLLLYFQWDLEKRLVSVAKLVENDIEWAGNHVKNSFFLRDYLAEEAFHKVQKHLDKQKPAPELSTGEYIFQIAYKAEELHAKNLHNEDSQEQELQSKASTSIFQALSPWYWVKQFLFSPYLVDARADNFRFWFQIYLAFSIILMLLLIFFSISTILTLLNMQGVLQDLPFNWVDWMAWTDSKQGSFLATSTRALRGTGLMQSLQAEVLALEAENRGLQQQNAALLVENTYLEAHALRP